MFSVLVNRLRSLRLLMVSGILMPLFFFSSRRRHTRSLCDWSSDVCSSDLRKVAVEFTREVGVVRYPGRKKIAEQRERSEERRVGKECRSRWSTSHLKKNMVCMVADRRVKSLRKLFKQRVMRRARLV